jgi:pilus assembly protein CpaF
MSIPASGPPPGGEIVKPRLPWQSPPAGEASAPRPSGGQPKAPAADAHYFQQIKGRVHRRLIERLNLSNLERVSREQVVEAIRKVVHDLISQEMIALNFDERELLVVQVLDEIFGLGPLEPLMQDSDISDILVNT